MAKKQLTFEQQEQKAIKSERRSVNFVSFVAFLLAVVITFGVVLSANTYAKSVKENTVEASSNFQENTDNETATPDNLTDSTDNAVVTPGESGNNTMENESEGDQSAEVDKNEDKKTGAFSSTAEIVEYFNTSANKVKKDATRVVKNYEKRVVRELKVPDVLQSTADSLIKTAMKDDTDPIVYATKEDIRNEFLVPNQDYVSVVKPEYLEKATYKDNGKEYEIYLLLKDEENATSGKGVGSVCDVIEAYEVQEQAPSFLTKFSTYYFDCEVTATIDKETGRLTHIVYSTPVNLDVSVNLFGKHDASVGFTFIKDYTITY